MPKLIPNYLTIDPVTGDVGAVFPGGVQILAAEGVTTPPNERTIQWVQELDGTVVAEMSGRHGTDGGNGVELNLENLSRDASIADILMEAGTHELVNGFDDPGARLEVTARDDLGTAKANSQNTQIRATAWNNASAPGLIQSVTPIDASGCSSFVVINSATALWLLTPAPSQAVPALAAGAGFIGGALNTGLPIAGAGSMPGNGLTYSGSRVFGGVTGANITWSFTLSTPGNVLHIAYAAGNPGAGATPACTITASILSVFV